MKKIFTLSVSRKKLQFETGIPQVRQRRKKQQGKGWPRILKEKVLNVSSVKATSVITDFTMYLSISQALSEPRLQSCLQSMFYDWSPFNLIFLYSLTTQSGNRTYLLHCIFLRGKMVSFSCLVCLFFVVVVVGGGGFLLLFCLGFFG